ncbi:hypothetical protein Poly41_00830 [Novipirellula artificiosorum]|uniref:Uncharacterized protein n=1 Tax=Novipirellula artificiosorum TaxID=2528016 RepID=A0A5C6E2F6_9BACT|nr:hypothetical protein Poly41_00830 [Novipirellula artificiosorum]
MPDSHPPFRVVKKHTLDSTCSVAADRSPVPCALCKELRTSRTSESRSNAPSNQNVSKKAPPRRSYHWRFGYRLASRQYDTTVSSSGSGYQNRDRNGNVFPGKSGESRGSTHHGDAGKENRLGFAFRPDALRSLDEFPSGSARGVSRLSPANQVRIANDQACFIRLHGKHLSISRWRGRDETVCPRIRDRCDRGIGRDA